MKTTIDSDLCSGCGLCVDVSPKVFEMEGDVAVVIATPVPADAEDDTREGAESCPVEAIEIEE
jgi:ferredoxin